MKVLPQSNQAAYDSLRTRVDAAMGYPYTAVAGDRRGIGPWVPLAQSITQTALGFVLHPITSQIGALIPPEAEPVLTVGERLLLVPLDLVWTLTGGPGAQGAQQAQAGK